MWTLRTHQRATDSDVELEMRRLILTLHANGVEAVDTLQGLLQWQIAFYSDETIPARFRRPRERYPPIRERVDSIRAAGGRTALVGPGEPFPELRDVVRPVGSDYYVMPDPPDWMLRLLKFTSSER